MEYSTDFVLALISRIHTKSAEFTNSRLPQENGLVSSHGFILFQLAEKEKLTMKDIASIINRDKSTTTVLIKKLLDKGLVKQESSIDDKRIKYITLTAKGKKLSAGKGDASFPSLQAERQHREFAKSHFLTLVLHKTIFVFEV